MCLGMEEIDHLVRDFSMDDGNFKRCIHLVNWVWTSLPNL